MKYRKNKEKISILSLIQTGKFGIVEPGFTKEDVLTKFYQPDDKNYMGSGNSIWRYSTFEFHFYENELQTLWCDNFDYLKGPSKKQFRLDKWILDKYESLTLKIVLSHLDDLQIEYKLRGSFWNPNQEYPENVIVEIIGSMSNLYFEPLTDEYIDYMDYKFIGIGAEKEKRYYKTKDL